MINILGESYILAARMDFRGEAISDTGNAVATKLEKKSLNRKVRQQEKGRIKLFNSSRFLRLAHNLFA